MNSVPGFLVPTFEIGRKAGLGVAFEDTSASGLEVSWQTGASVVPGVNTE